MFPSAFSSIIGQDFPSIEAGDIQTIQDFACIWLSASPDPSLNAPARNYPFCKNSNSHLTSRHPPVKPPQKWQARWLAGTGGLPVQREEGLKLWLATLLHEIFSCLKKVDKTNNHVGTSGKFLYTDCTFKVATVRSMFIEFMNDFLFWVSFPSKCIVQEQRGILRHWQ